MDTGTALSGPQLARFHTSTKDVFRVCLNHSRARRGVEMDHALAPSRPEWVGRNLRAPNPGEGGQDMTAPGDPSDSRCCSGMFPFSAHDPPLPYTPQQS